MRKKALDRKDLSFVLKSYSKAINQSSFLLTLWPQQIFPQVYNRLQTIKRKSELLNRELEESRKIYKKPWLKILNPSEIESGFIRSFAGHYGDIHYCLFSPDGDFLISASWDKTLRVWDVKNGKEILCLRGHKSYIFLFCISPDGRLIASNSDKLEIIIWDLITGKELFREEGSWVETFSPDNRLLLTNTRDGSLILWDVKDKRKFFSFKGFNPCVFTSDSRYFVFSNLENSIIIFDIKLKKEIHSVKIEAPDSRILTISPDGRKIAIASNAENSLQVRDIFSHNMLYEWKGDVKNITVGEWSPDDRQIAIATKEGLLSFWNFKEERMIPAFDRKKNLSGYLQEDRYRAFNFDSKYFAVWAYGTLEIWETDTGNKFLQRDEEGAINAFCFHPNYYEAVTKGDGFALLYWELEDLMNSSSFKERLSPVQVCHFSPDGKKICSLSENEKTLRFWCAETGDKIIDIEGHKGEIKDFDFSPDGKKLVSASADNTLKIWETEKYQEIKSFELHCDKVLSCSFSRDGEMVISLASDDITEGGGGEEIILWDIETGKAVDCFGDRIEYYVEELTDSIGLSKSSTSTFSHNKRETEEDLPGPGIYCCCLSNDNSFVVTTCYEKKAKIWNADTCEKVNVLKEHKDSIRSISFSPDGILVATGSADKTVKVWNKSSKKSIWTFKGHKGILNSCIFSPDGKQIATASDDYSIILLDVHSHRKTHILLRHDFEVDVCKYSPDGKYIASGGLDWTLCLWNALNGKERTSINILPGQVSTIDFSPDGKKIVVGNRQGKILIFSIENIRSFPPVITCYKKSDKLYFRCPKCLTEIIANKLLLGSKAECSNCSNAVQLNPFYVDVKDLKYKYKNNIDFKKKAEDRIDILKNYKKYFYDIDDFIDYDDDMPF